MFLDCCDLPIPQLSCWLLIIFPGVHLSLTFACLSGFQFSIEFPLAVYINLGPQHDQKLLTKKNKTGPPTCELPTLIKQYLRSFHSIILEETPSAARFSGSVKWQNRIPVIELKVPAIIIDGMRRGNGEVRW